MVIGEEGRPQGVGVGGIRARGVKVGEGRDERPVPPMMAMGTASVYVVGRLSILRVRLVELEIGRRGLMTLFGWRTLKVGNLSMF